MKVYAAVVCLLASLGGAVPAAAAMLIANDSGGRIDQYLYKYAAIRASGERVVIDGPCLSACTLVLSAVPRNRICVTSRAALGFHAAWQFSEAGTPVHSNGGTRFLWAAYPQHVRRWIQRNGGLRSRMIFLRGHELAAMYQACG
jgi:hypothetical protein